MTPLEQLFIRACKSKDPLTRLHSIMRRFYVADFNHYPHVIGTLADICDKYSVITTRELLHALDHSQNWKYRISGIDTYQLVCVRVLISKIRLTEIVKFTGLPIPTWIKNLSKETRGVILKSQYYYTPVDISNRIRYISGN